MNNLHLRAKIIITKVSISALIILNGLLLWNVMSTAYVLLLGYHASDATIFWTIGQNILNGLVPYVDIFENKPPIIFFLSAASIALFSSPLLGNMLGASIMVAMPACIVFAVYVLSRNEGNESRIVSLFAAFTFSLLLALYSFKTAGGWQTEFFASLFGTIYVVSVAIPQGNTFSRMRLFFAVLGMTLAVGTKEPFLLPLLGSALLFSTSPRDIYERIILPMIFTTVVGVFMLIVSGLFSAYIHNYLFTMLGMHILRFQPPWVGGLQFEKAALQLSSFSIFWSLSIAAMIVAPFVSKHRTLRKDVFVLGSIYSFFAWSMARLAAGIFPLGWAGFIAVIGVVVAVTVVFRGVVISRWNEGLVSGIAWGFSLYLAMAAIGISGDYQGHHFAFAVPFYVALGITALTRVVYQSPIVYRALILAILTVAAVHIVVTFNGSDLLVAYHTQANADEKARTVAQEIDDLLDACHYSTYAFLGQNEVQYYAYTKHPPDNFFIFSAYEHLTRYHPYVLSRSLEKLSNTPILIIPGENYDPKGSFESEDTYVQYFVRGIAYAFTNEIPACAEGKLPNGYVAVFRRKGTEGWFPVSLKNVDGNWRIQIKNSK